MFVIGMAPETLVDGIETEIELTIAYELTSRVEADGETAEVR